MLCDYGCGKEAIYQLKNGKWCCQKSQNSCDAVKNKVVIEITDFEGYKICDYGCGEKASYRFTNGKVCCYSYKSCSAVREKNKKSNIGRIGPNKGKKTGPLTIEHRQKLSKSLTGKKHTKEHNKNIGKGGGLSIAAVYDLLFETRNKILILDDFDTPLRNEDTVNMLKAITDSYDKRILSISREKRMNSGQNQGSSETPSKFEYKGKLVIVTNLKKSEIDRALLSRAPAFEVSFNNKEIIEALQIMLEYINPNVSMEIKKEVLDYILILHKKNPEIQIDFRAFKNSVDARVGNPLYWKEMIQTIVGYN